MNAHSSIPRIHLAQLPTPIEAMPRLSALLNGPTLLVKRDDQTGLAFGGNKTRKLEFLVGDALARGANILVTAGALQSNHCRQTAAAAARVGLECCLVLVGQAPLYASANLLIDQLLGARVVWTDKTNRDEILKKTVDDLAGQGKKPYLVPYGGSSPTGVLGYAFAMQEFLAQKIHADWIVFASSSGGTHAGLVLGQRAFGYQGKVLGISIDEPQQVLTARVASLASETSRLLGELLTISCQDVLAESAYAAPGYGVMTAAEKEAILLFARYEGLLLDPVYTGRMGAGLIDLVRKGYFKKDETVLVWHTGGQPALFAEQYQALLQGT